MASFVSGKYEQIKQASVVTRNIPISKIAKLVEHSNAEGIHHTRTIQIPPAQAPHALASPNSTPIRPGYCIARDDEIPFLKEKFKA